MLTLLVTWHLLGAMPCFVALRTNHRSVPMSVFVALLWPLLSFVMCIAFIWGYCSGKPIRGTGSVFDYSARNREVN